MNDHVILDLALAIIPTVIAITFHEVAHGYAALALGDTTARDARRLSFNPLRHVDRVGTILLPGFLLVSQLVTMGRVVFMFGWAKPVPVNPRRFANPRRGMALVACAGPLMNFFLAWVAAMLDWATPLLPDDWSDPAGTFLTYTFIGNLALGLFNLIPIPPLDGGRVAVGLLPLPLAIRWARLERAGLALVILVVFLLPRFLDGLGVHFDPVHDGLERGIAWAGRLILLLAGHHV